MLTVHGSIMLITAQHGLPPCRLTNRWEASLWLKGRQLYLGGFNSEEDAARAYDIVALSCKGLHVATNFPSAAYTAELAELAGSTQVWLQPLVLPCVTRSAMPAIRGDATVATRHLGLRKLLQVSFTYHKVSILNVLTGLCTGGDCGICASEEQCFHSGQIPLPWRVRTQRTLGSAHRRIWRPEECTF